MKKILVIIIVGLLGVVGYQMNQVVKLENKLIEKDKTIKEYKCYECVFQGY